MSIDVIPINGKSDFVDYDLFEKSLRSVFKDKCHDAKAFLFNNFPVVITSETFIDLILILAINPEKGNYFGVSKDSGYVYINNIIVPIKFIGSYKDSKLEIDGKNQLVSNEEYIDYTTEIQSIKTGLINYLSHRCKFKHDELYIHPLIFIENAKEIVMNEYLIAPKFDFYVLKKYLRFCNQEIFISYKDWKTDWGYTNISTDIERIAEQASKDSEIGYLTKRKIERIAKQLSNAKTIYEELNKSLVIITGKAGTGKSSELLLLTMRCIDNGQNTLYLTYNKVLIFDISNTIHSYRNSRLNKQHNVKLGEAAVLTLHAFFYRLSKSLGVLHILGDVRIQKILIELKQRMRIVFDFVKGGVSKGEEINFGDFKTAFQNNDRFDIGTKEVGIDFVNYLKRMSFDKNKDLVKFSKDYYNYKKQKLSLIGANEVFLADYYGVLENTLLVIQNDTEFFQKYNVQDKFELLELVLKLEEKHTEEIEDQIKIKPKAFREKRNRIVGGHKRKRTLFIDEAQDCNRLEKDILIAIYNSENLVVANGGKEQLIRHGELCNWEVSQSKKLSVRKHFTRTKSYRVKKAVVDFCNFVAQKYQIDFNLEPLESDDDGEIIFDFNNKHTDQEIFEILNKLNLKGAVHGCNAYEGLLILLESKSLRTDTHNNQARETVIINEYGNIEETARVNRGTWNPSSYLEGMGFMFWDGTVEDKSKLMTPKPNESRVIYYESCRGIEAWSVCCFALDKFFTVKREDPDAERYLLDDLLLNQNNDQRKSMFAATWVLMAMSRVIDTLYVQICDDGSEFGKIVREYLSQSNRNNIVIEKRT